MAAVQPSDAIVETVAASSGVSARAVAEQTGIRIMTVVATLIHENGKRVKARQGCAKTNALDVIWEGL